MPEPRIDKPNVRHAGALIVLLALTPFMAAAASAANESLEACGKIDEEAARLACYDAAFRKRSNEERPAEAAGPPDATPAAVVATEPTAIPAEPDPVPVDQAGKESGSDAVHDQDKEEHAPLTDDVGLSQVNRNAGAAEGSFQAEVISCSLHPSGKYYFHFDNGQVWRQSGGGRQEFEDCEFTVTIKKDAFGFKMRPDTGARPVRIKRIK